jgi:hypothetical protein
MHLEFITQINEPHHVPNPVRPQKASFLHSYIPVCGLTITAEHLGYDPHGRTNCSASATCSHFPKPTFHHKPCVAAQYLSNLASTPSGTSYAQKLNNDDDGPQVLRNRTAAEQSHVNSRVFLGSF